MITIKELKEFLDKLPEEFDEFEMVNGEEGVVDEEYSYRIDKPIVAMFIDEETEEFVLCHKYDKDANKGEGNNLTDNLNLNE